MSFFGDLGNALGLVGSTGASAVNLAYDLALTPIGDTDKEDLADSWRSFSGKGTRVMTGINEAPVIGDALQAQYAIYSNVISQPISTGLLALNKSNPAGGNSLGNLFKGDTWSDSWHDANNVSPGQMLLANSQQGFGGLGRLLDDNYDAKTKALAEEHPFFAYANASTKGFDPANPEDKEDLSGGLGRFITGGIDGLLAWKADPFLLAGKGASKGIQASKVKAPTTRADLASLAQQADDHLKWTTSGGAEGRRTGFGQFIEDSTKLDAFQLLNDSRVTNSSRPDLLAGLLGGSNDFRTNELVVRAAAGDNAARLALKEADIGRWDSIETAATGMTREQTSLLQKLDEADLVKTLDDGTVEVNPDWVLLEGLDMAAVEDAGKIFAQAVEKDPWMAKLVEHVENPSPVMGDMGSKSPWLQAQATRRTVARTERKLSPPVAAGWSTREFVHHPFGRTMRIVEWLGDETPAGWVNIRGASANDGAREIQAALAQVKIWKGEDGIAKRATWVNRYLDANTSAQRAGVVTAMEKDILKEMADTHLPGMDKAARDTLIDAMHDQHHRLRTTATKHLGEKGFLVEADGTLTKAPVFESQMGQILPVADFSMYDNLMRRETSTFTRHAGRVTDTMKDAYDVLMSVWRPMVLLRLGYTQRNVGESSLRAAAYLQGSFNVDGFMYTAGRAAGNSYDRASRLVVGTGHRVQNLPGLRTERKMRDTLASLHGQRRGYQSELDNIAADEQLIHQAVPAGPHGAFLDRDEYYASAKPQHLTPEELTAGATPAWDGGPTLFHGSSSPIDELAGTHELFQSQNMVGAGLYTTDSLKVAKGYTGKGAGGNPTIHEVKWAGDAPPKMLNLDEVANDELVNAVRMNLGDMADDIPSRNQSGTELIADARRAMEDNGVTRSHAEEIIQGISENLQARGFDGFVHTGGTKVHRSGPHTVNVFFDTSKLKVASTAERKASQLRALAQKRKEGSRLGYLDAEGNPVFVKTLKDIPDEALLAGRAAYWPSHYKILKGALERGERVSPEAMARYPRLRQYTNPADQTEMRWSQEALTQRGQIGTRIAEMDRAIADLERRLNYWDKKQRYRGQKTEPKSNKPRRGGRGQVKFAENDFNDAFADVTGENALIWSSGAPRTAQELAGPGSYMNRRLDTRNSWSVVHPADKQYYDALARVLNQQVRNSPVAMKVIAGESAEEIAAWARNSREGRAWVKQFGLEDAGVTPKIQDVAATLERYLPDHKMWNRLRQGESLTARELRNSLAGRDLQPIHGPKTVEALGGMNPIAAGWQRFTRAGFKYLGNIPEDVAARHPFYRSVYQKELKSQAELLQAQLDGRKVFTQAEKASLEKAAHARAIHELKRTLYTIERYSNAAQLLRWFAPFFASWANSMRSWGRLTLNNPAIAAQGGMLWTAPERAGISRDPEGNRVAVGEADGDTQIPLQLPHLGAKDSFYNQVVDAVGRAAIPKHSANIVFQGEPWWNPGMGPTIQVPANHFVRMHPNYGEAAKNLGLLPFGATRTPGIKGDIEMVLAPWMKKAYAVAVGEDSVEYANSMSSIMQAEMGKYNRGERDTKPTMDEIKDRANKYWLVRIGANLLLPAAPRFESPSKFYIDEYRRLQQEDASTANEKFLELYPDHFEVMTSLSKNLSGMQSSQAAYQATQKYGDLIASIASTDKSLIGLVTNGPADYQFDPNVYSWQFGAKIAPGSPDTYRTNQSPEEVAKQANVTAGWTQYIKTSDQIQAVMESRGLTSLNSTGAADLAQIKRDFVAQLAESNPDWWYSYQERDAGQTAKTITALDTIVTDKQFMADNGDDPKWQAVAAYLDNRDMIRQILKAREAAGYSGTLTAESNSDIAQVWAQLNANLVASNTDFADMYSRYLENDDVGMVPNVQP